MTVGEFKIGRIAQSRQPHLTNDVPHDPNIGDAAWAEREGMVAFAGYPLLVEEQVYGVLALFARAPLHDGILKDLHPIADGIAQFINRKQVEESLRLSEQRYALAEQATNDGVWDWYPLTGEDYLSPRWKALLGFAEDELANTDESFFSRIHPDDAATVTEAVRLHFEEHQPYDVELRLRCKDESYRWFRSRGEGLRDNSGTVVRMVGSIIDITERKLAEAEIRRHKDQLTAFFENASVGLHWVDAEGIIQWANQAEMELLGYSAEEYIGQSITKFHADQNVIADILERLARGEKLNEYEARLTCKDGSERIVSINSSVHWEEGRFIHTQCFTQDITERKRAEAALQESYRFNQTVLDSMSEHIAVLNRNGEIIAVNRAWQQFAQTNSEKGDGQQQYTGMNYLTVCRNASGPFADQASAALEGIKSVLEGAIASFILEYPCHSPQEERWFLMSVTPLPTSRGGAVIAHLNITARKRAEAKLAEQQAQFLTLAESIPQLAWMAGPDGYIHWYNRRWYEYTGTTPEQMEGWGWQRVHD
ncbi:MAG: PAS domain S-box protein, partial [Pseudonocardiaceae bacterium]